jgi:Icc-related predicted phosphoesterase
MILLLGDAHGYTGGLETAIRQAKEKGAAAIIQVGDLGLYYNKNLLEFYNVVKESTVPIYFIDGNHDECEKLNPPDNKDDLYRIFDDANLWYVHRGAVIRMDGRTIAFMGGASTPKFARDEYWNPAENITSDQFEKLQWAVRRRIVDLFITHTPPRSVLDKHFDDVLDGNVVWKDRNAEFIDIMWEWLYPRENQSPIGGPIQLYCGHMHKSIIGPNYRILEINEILEV